MRFLELDLVFPTADSLILRLSGVAETRQLDFRLCGETNLWASAFGTNEAAQILATFRDSTAKSRILSITSSRPEIQKLPWESLVDPERGSRLEEEGIAIRRRIPSPHLASPTPRDALHLLFVVCRPSARQFADPRAGVLPALGALEASQEIVWEFLRPPSSTALAARLASRHVEVVQIDAEVSYDAPGPRGKPAAGYLLFEAEDGEACPVSVDSLGTMLRKQGVALLVLTGSPHVEAAIRLVKAGVPSVIVGAPSLDASGYGRLYRRLAQGKPIAEALFEERRSFTLGPLPVLYQSDADVPIVEPNAAPLLNRRTIASNLPEPTAQGFHGREHELWQIEKWLLDGARRVTLTGLIGAGKSTLANETARWLTSTGLFQAAASVDLRAGLHDLIQIVSSVLQTEPTADSIGDALQSTPTILVFEHFDHIGASDQKDLLDLAARWSDVGQSRVLCTTRKPALGHPAFPAAGSTVHRQMRLALLPYGPTTQRLNDSFASPGLSQAVESLDPDLRRLLPCLAVFAGGAAENNLTAITRLGDAHAPERRHTLAFLNAATSPSPRQALADIRQALPKEANLGEVVGLRQRQLEGLQPPDRNVWNRLRRRLEDAGLIELERIPHVPFPFVHIHPGLAAALEDQLESADLESLRTAHRLRYAIVAHELAREAQINFGRAKQLAAREIGNMRAAVAAAQEAGDAAEPEFAETVEYLTSILAC